MKFKSNNKRKAGFTLLEIFVVVTIIGLLAAIAISNFVIARDNSRLTVISTNLREIESAHQELARAHGHFEEISSVGQPRRPVNAAHQGTDLRRQRIQQNRL